MNQPSASSQPSQPSVSVCVCTYRRPTMLRRLLAALGEVDLHLDGPDNPAMPIEIVIADNDPERSGLAAVDAFTAAHPDFPHPIVTTHVTPANISLARNGAAAAATAAWTAWVDDDEIPERGWLAALVRTQRVLGAEVVLGAVVPLIDEAMPGWLVEGEERYWGRPRFPTGTPVPTNGTRAGNVLLRRDHVIEVGFDTSYGVSGGEDSMFFWELAQRGIGFVWCDESVVAEEVPQSRRSVEYVVRRGYLGGLSYARVELGRLARGAQLRRAASILASAVLRWPVAIAMVGFSWLTNARPRGGPSARTVHWRRTAAAQRGKVAAVIAAVLPGWRQRSAITDRA